MTGAVLERKLHDRLPDTVESVRVEVRETRELSAGPDHDHDTTALDSP